MADGDGTGGGGGEVVDVGDEGAVEVELPLGAEGEGGMDGHLLAEAGGLKKGGGGDGIRRACGADAEWGDPGELVAVKGSDDGAGDGSGAHETAESAV